MNILRKEPKRIFNSKGVYEIQDSGPRDNFSWFYVFLGTNALDERDMTKIARFETKERAIGWVENGANQEELFEDEKVGFRDTGTCVF